MSFVDDYINGISWGDAKNKLFEVVNKDISARKRIRCQELLQVDNDFINDLAQRWCK